MHVVVVESPAKAKTINKYLGSDYQVVASYGHVRDLPAKNGSVRPDESFAMDWEIDPKSEQRLKAIRDALKGADALYLATDPDREGEAISWHVLAELERRGALKGVDVKRIVFSEITKSAVLDAIANPRDLDENLIDAYRARRALDYLVGFTLSPVLWRKLPGSRSAGRVQSVALRLICEREIEIEAFEPREYWTVEAMLHTAAGKPLKTRLTHLDGEKLGKFGLADEAAAALAVDAIRGRPFAVAEMETKEVGRNPAPPFTTSTLQQEASRKLGFSAKQTMQVAQKLYEGIDLGGETVGLITYMRTDGVQMASVAIDAARDHIAERFGAPYLPAKPRIYRSKAKNAQEAHEAIRPTDPGRTPDELSARLDRDQLRLYELIWKRTMASQMAGARLQRAAIDVDGADGRARLRATGQVVVFDGFLRLYQEGRDEADQPDEKEGTLPKVAKGEALDVVSVEPAQHFTEPPPRFTEASLVKNLEELGIGRPSTYASILSVLQDRDYVILENKHFVPEDRGRLVTAFLVSYFHRYVEYDFTAQLENRLDDVSAGRVDWTAVLEDFWSAFAAAVAETDELRVKDALDAVEKILAPHIFPARADGIDPRVCPACAEGQVNLKLGKFGAFVGCSNYPECKYTRPLTEGADGPIDTGPRELGADPETGEAISLRKGPYGYYVQRGEAAEKKDKPKRTSLPKGLTPDSVDLDRALGLLALPRDVGPHPETGKMIKAGIGRFGPYLQYDGGYRSLAADDDVLTVGLNRAVALLAEPKGRRAGAAVLRELGAHPRDQAPVTLRKGRYGPYVHHKGMNASLGRDQTEDSLTLEEAVALIDTKGKKPGGRKGSKTAKTTRTKRTRKAAPAGERPSEA